MLLRTSASSASSYMSCQIFDDLCPCRRCATWWKAWILRTCLAVASNAEEFYKLLPDTRLQVAVFQHCSIVAEGLAESSSGTALYRKADAYLKEDSGHRMQGLFRPRLKPVDDRVVYQARKVAAACAQGFTHRRHGQHHMQVVAALQHKLGPASVLVVITALLHSLQDRRGNLIYQVSRQSL